MAIIKEISATTNILSIIMRDLEIDEGNTYTFIDLLKKGIIEVGIVRTPFKTLNFEYRYANTEPMIAAMSKEYYEDSSPLPMAVNELKDKPLILYRRFEQLIYEICLEHGFEPNIFCKNDDARTILLWANAGLGVAIIPKFAFKLASNNNLLHREIDSEKLETRIVSI